MSSQIIQAMAFTHIMVIWTPWRSPLEHLNLSVHRTKVKYRLDPKAMDGINRNLAYLLQLNTGFSIHSQCMTNIEVSQVGRLTFDQHLVK